MNKELGLLISFPDQSESFVLGFEAGSIYHELQAKPDFLERKVPIHRKNLELINKICLEFSYLPSYQDTEYEEWIYFKCIKLTGTDN